MPRRRPGKWAGAMPLICTPLEMAHCVKAWCSSPGEVIAIWMVLTKKKEVREMDD